MIEMIPYIRHDLTKDGIEKFLEITFGDYFIDEIKRIQHAFFKNYKPENVFALNERAWIGVLNNAILKAFPGNSSTIQEFCIYNCENIHKGRADLLVQWEFNDKNYNLLFEAKHQGEASGKHIFDDLTLCYKKIRHQAKRYYDEEIQFFNDSKTYIIAIAFEWFRKPKNLEKAHGYFNQANSSDDFCYLYHENGNGMWVYGKIFPAVAPPN